MNTKRGSAKGVSLAKRKANVNAFDKLGDNPTEEQLKEAAATVALAELEERVADVRDSWESDSLFEDVFEDLANNPSAAKKNGESCPRLLSLPFPFLPLPISFISFHFTSFHFLLAMHHNPPPTSSC